MSRYGKAREIAIAYMMDHYRGGGRSLDTAAVVTLLTTAPGPLKVCTWATARDIDRKARNRLAEGEGLYVLPPVRQLAFLREPHAIAPVRAVAEGTRLKDLRTRAYNIKNRLEATFNEADVTTLEAQRLANLRAVALLMEDAV
jgi:hypothetical protein